MRITHKHKLRIMTKLKLVIKKGLLAGFMALAGTFIAGNSLQAAEGDLININFGEGAFIGSAADDLGGYWNAYIDPNSSEEQSLLTSAPGASDIGVSWTSDGFTNSANHGFGTDKIMKTYVYTESTDTVTITGLEVGATYDLYVYSQMDDAYDPENLGIEINDTYTLSTTGSDVTASSYVLGQNYLVQSFTADSSTLTIDYYAADGDGTVVLNAIQLLQTSSAPSPVPEPASMLLIGVGGAAVVALRKRLQVRNAS